MKFAIKDVGIVAIALFVIVLVVAGEAVVYTSNYTNYNADATYSDGVIDYTVESKGSKNYNVVVSDNGEFASVDAVYIYYDESYKSCGKDGNIDVGAKRMDQNFYVSQLEKTLIFNGVKNVKIVDADALRDCIDNGSCKALVCLSGALPDTVYNGTSSSKIISWIENGGRLYWIGNLIGAYISTQQSLTPVENYQELFFGAKCLNTGNTSKAMNAVSGNDYRSALSIICNDVKYGVDVSKLPAGTKSLAVGYMSDDGYASAALVQKGNGFICVFGGDYTNYQRMDVAKIISSGITPLSYIVAEKSGTVTNGSVSGKIDVSKDGLTTYIYLGGYYTVFGKLFHN